MKITKIVFSATLIVTSLFANEKNTTAPQSQDNSVKVTTTTTVAADEKSKSLGLYVFPSKEQTAQQQYEDEGYCYDWAKKQTNYDPANPTKVTAEPVKSGPDGSAVSGAARGAVAGVAIGAIAGDAGKGAAIGATAGGMGGLRKRRVKSQATNAAAQSEAKSMENSLREDYNKAFSACLEGKGYTVK